MKLQIAICGLGIAGKARLPHLQKHSLAELAGTVSRRGGTLIWEDLLANPKIEAVIIATENTDHESKVEAALNAGKHVLCDYPLALSGSKAEMLFELAKSKNKTLHVEHIGLLTQSHLKFRHELITAEKLKSGTYFFQAGWNEKLANPMRTGPILFSSISRFLQIADWLGEFEIQNVTQNETKVGFEAQMNLVFKEGQILTYHEKRATGLPRKRFALFEFENKKVELQSEMGGENLFAQDLDWFICRVRGEKRCYYQESQMLKLLHQIELIHGR